jgi:ribosomal protein S18 acetylase RimI-like enzyme
MGSVGVREDGPVLTIREGRPDDAEGITRIHLTGWQRGYADLMPAAYLEGRLTQEPERIEQRRTHLTSPEGVAQTLVAVDGADVVGFANFGADREEPTLGEVYAIYVDPDRLSTGIGRALMDEAVRRLRGRDLMPVRLWVLAGNARGLTFYERYGFRPDGGRSAFVVEQPGELPIELPELRLSLHL